MEQAAQEERDYAIENGRVDEDGTPLCTVVADGMWSKRSYKTKYNALSGTVWFTLSFFYNVFETGLSLCCPLLQNIYTFQQAF
jgi:hypothetical protein